MASGVTFNISPMITVGRHYYDGNLTNKLPNVYDGLLSLSTDCFILHTTHVINVLLFADYTN